MAVDDDNTEPKSLLERHIQTILISIITAAILFSATFIFNTNKDGALIAQQVTQMTVQLNALSLKMDSMQTNYVTRAEFKDHEDRLRVIEKK